MEADNFSIVSGTTEGSSPLLYTALSQNFVNYDHKEKLRVLQTDSVSPVVPELTNNAYSKGKKTASDALIMQTEEPVTSIDLREETMINNVTEKKNIKLKIHDYDLDKNTIQIQEDQGRTKSQEISSSEIIPGGLRDKLGQLCSQFEGSQDLFESENISDYNYNITPTQRLATPTTLFQNFTAEISSVPSLDKSPSSCHLAGNMDFIKNYVSLQGKIDKLNNVHEDERDSIMTCSTVPPAPSRQLSPKCVSTGIPQGFSKEVHISQTNSLNSAVANISTSVHFLQESQLNVELITSRLEGTSQLTKSMTFQNESTFMLNEAGSQGQSRRLESRVVTILEPIGSFPSNSRSQSSGPFDHSDSNYDLSRGGTCKERFYENINTDDCWKIGKVFKVGALNTFDKEIQILPTGTFREDVHSSGGEKVSTSALQNAVPPNQILDGSSEQQSHKGNDGKNSQKHQSKTIAHDRELECLSRLVTLYDQLLEKLERKNFVSGIIPQLDKFQTVIDKLTKSQDEERRRLVPWRGKEKKSRSQLMDHEVRVRQLGERQALLQVALSKNKLLTERVRPYQADLHRRRDQSEDTSLEPENISLTSQNISLLPETASDQGRKKTALSNVDSRFIEKETLSSQTDEVILQDAESYVSGHPRSDNDSNNKQGVTNSCRSLQKRKTSLLPHEAQHSLEPSTQGRMSPTSGFWQRKTHQPRETMGPQDDESKKKRLDDELVPLGLKQKSIQERKHVNCADQRKMVIPDQPTGSYNVAGAQKSQTIDHRMSSQGDHNYFFTTSVKQVEIDFPSKENVIKAIRPLSSPVRSDNRGTLHSHLASAQLNVVGSSCPTSLLGLEISSVTKPDSYNVIMETSDLTTGDTDTLNNLSQNSNLFKDSVLPPVTQTVLPPVIQTVLPPVTQTVNGLTETIQKTRYQLTQDLASQGHDYILGGDGFSTKIFGKMQEPAMHHRPPSPCSTVSSCLFPVSSKEIIRRIENKCEARKLGLKVPSIKDSHLTGSDLAHGSKGNCGQMSKCVLVTKSQTASKYKYEAGTRYNPTTTHGTASQFNNMSMPSNNTDIPQTGHSDSNFHPDMNITAEKSTPAQTNHSPEITQNFYTLKPNLQKNKKIAANPGRKRGRPRQSRVPSTLQCIRETASKQKEIQRYFPIIFTPSGQEDNKADELNSEILKRQPIKSGPSMVGQSSTTDGNFAATPQNEKSHKQGFFCGRDEQAMDPVLLLKGIRTIQLIEDEEVTGTTDDIPGDFWLEDFAEMRMSESFWNTVDSW